MGKKQKQQDTKQEDKKEEGEFCGTFILKPRSGGMINVSEYQISGMLHNNSDDEFTLWLVKKGKK